MNTGKNNYLTKKLTKTELKTMSTSQQQRFLNKVVIITGSSSGMGREGAIEIAKEGGSVVIHGQNAQKLAETEELILASGVPQERILKVVGPIEDEKTQGRLISETEQFRQN